MASNTNNSTDFTIFVSVPNSPNITEEVIAYESRITLKNHSTFSISQGSNGNRTTGATGTSELVIVNHGSAHETASVTVCIQRISYFN